MDEALATESDSDDLADFELDLDVSIVRSKGVRIGAWAVLVLVAGAVTAGFISAAVGDPQRGRAAVGELSEAAGLKPADLRATVLVDSTDDWSLVAHRWDVSGLDRMAGGLVMTDIDGDGDLDLVAAQGSVRVFRWDGDSFMDPVILAVDDAMAVTAADVDRDGNTDLLIARDASNDTILWGGSRLLSGGQPERTDLEGTAPSAGLLAGELSGDDAIDVVQLGRGTDSGAPDRLWIQDANEPRRFVPVQLGVDERLSLAGELVDADLDGLLDIWVTRDVGWDTGPDSIYSRQGDPEGPWVDVAADLGADLAIDGMGVTLADLDGDARLDAYVSDLGDNEVLIRHDHRFEPVTNSGAARIRPLGADSSIVSSSWASGAADLNLDGQLDLVVANGGFPAGGMRNKIPFTTVAVEDTPALLIGIGDGQFVDAWADIGEDWNEPSRGLTIGDIDNDGDDDLVFLSANGTLRSFRNDTTGPTVTVKAERGCDSAGAVITATQAGRSYQTLLRPHTYSGAHSDEMVVGTADNLTAVTVRWADGIITDLTLPLSPPERYDLIAGCPAGR